jgi:hypothetical protein
MKAKTKAAPRWRGVERCILCGRLRRRANLLWIRRQRFCVGHVGLSGPWATMPTPPPLRRAHQPPARGP